MSNKNEDKPTMPSISVFGAKPTNALLIPDMPISVRANCKTGQFVMGDVSQGARCAMTILKFAKFFGNLGLTTNVQWGQIWFLAESGDLPRGVVMVTYIKTRSLEAFSNTVAAIQAKGVEPANGIFMAEFVNHKGSKDINGVATPLDYYSVRFSWRERQPDEYETLRQAAAMMSDQANMNRLIDINGTRQLFPIDGISPQELKRLEKENPAEAVGILPDAQLNALPGATSNA